MKVNNQTYDFGSARVFLLGREVQGISGIEYSVSQEKGFNYGAGNQPVSVGRGRKTVESTLTLYGYELMALQQAVGQGKGIEDIPAFDLVISYGNDPASLTTVTLKHCEFTGFSTSLDNENTSDEFEVPMIVAAIEVS